MNAAQLGHVNRLVLGQHAAQSDRANDQQHKTGLAFHDSGSEVVLRRTKPAQRTTGCGGYLGKWESCCESRQSKNCEPLPDTIVRAYLQLAHKLSIMIQ